MRAALEPGRATGAPRTVVTTSWDDGHVLDLRLAELLERNAVGGTFYVAPRSIELDVAERLTAPQVRHLAARFEIGGHTLTHQRLTALDGPAAKGEIVDGKAELEDILGSAVTSFCYPGGQYDASHVQMVGTAGFTGARTVERFVSSWPHDLLQMGTTVHAYRHLVDLPMRRRGLRDPRHAASYWRNWDDLAITLFERTLRRGGVYHLWGHSWEVVDRGDWARLERVLEHIGRRADVSYLTNGQLAALGGAGERAVPDPIVKVR